MIIDKEELNCNLYERKDEFVIKDCVGCGHFLCFYCQRLDIEKTEMIIFK